MRSRVLRRRSATVLGVYFATALGFLTTVVATRELGTGDYARFAAIVAATAFLQLLLDLTVEEALVKYGFRYAEAERWGRLRRHLRGRARVQAGRRPARAAIALVVARAARRQHLGRRRRARAAARRGALIPLLQAPEGVAGGAVILRGRYDVRGAFFAVSMGLRLAGDRRSARMFGLTGAVVGMVSAQVIATAAISIVGLAAFRRFPQARVGAARRGPAAPCAASSSPRPSPRRSSRRAATLGTALHAGRRADRPGGLLPQRAGAGDRASRRCPRRRGSSCSPSRRATSRPAATTRCTRCSAATSSARPSLMVVAVPVLLVADAVADGPRLRRRRSASTRPTRRGSSWSRPRCSSIWGWTKSFPVSIGRPGPADRRAGGRDRGLRAAAARASASKWGATGGAAAMLVSTAVFCAALDRAARARARRPTCGAGGARELKVLRRLRDLAARRGRAGLPRARGRRRSCAGAGTRSRP